VAQGRAHLQGVGKAMSDPALHWSFDKRIPLALIVTIIIQSGAAIWWASSLSSRVSWLEERISATSDQRDRIIRVETILERIEKKVDRIAP
jgi:hypothetical protein